MTTEGDPVYYQGRSPNETQRLIDQAKLYDEHTRFLFQSAGISTGMNVLDVGSGAGDVAFIAARLVGPTGSIVGVDQNPAVLETARARAEAMGLSNVRFIEGDIRTVDLPADFDAAVGRLVLMYSADPVATLNAVSGRVRPGGVVAFQEADLPLARVDLAARPLYGKSFEVIAAVFERSGVHGSMGTGLHRAFVDAGIGAPTMWAVIPMGGPAGWPGYGWFAASFQTALPVIEQLGIATAAELDVETLAERIEDEVVRTGLPLFVTPHVCAWTRTAAAHRS
jgi:ubiquinone/menaquinone biosynthesis C-methylase UbiE